MSRKAWSLLLGILLVLGVATTALAHATLSHATPEPDSVLEQAPTQVALQFSEEIEAQFGAISVFDHDGVRVDKGDAALDPKDVTRVIASLKPLKDGVYTVAYRIVSADGHPVTGSYGFTVGQGIAGSGYYKPELPDSNGLPPLLLLVGYWLAVGGLMVLAGLGFTQGLVLRMLPERGYVRWVWGALLAAVVGTLIYVVSRTAQAAGISMVDALNPTLLWRLLMTRTGNAVLARLILLVLMAAVTPLLGRRWWFALAAGAAGLVTVSLGGHAIALERPWLSVPLDWLHMLAAAIWLGGLLQFTVVIPAHLRGAEGPLSGAVRRFGKFAWGFLAVILLTGLYPALLHVPSLKALTQTAYGTTLITKLSLLVPLLLVGLVNYAVTGPRLRRGEPVGALLRRLSGLELTFMAVILGAAVLLTNLPPARVALPPEELNVGLHGQNYEAIVLEKPLQVGYRSFNLTLKPHEGGALPPDTKVSMELILLDHDMGHNLTEGTALGAGHYRFDNVLLGMPGNWKLRIVIERQQAEPEEILYQFVVPKE